MSSSRPAIRSPSTLVLITGCLEAFSLSPLPSLSLSFPLFVYHVEVDLCRLHLAELGGVGEIQQLKGREGEMRDEQEGGEEGEVKQVRPNRSDVSGERRER